MAELFKMLADEQKSLQRECYTIQEYLDRCKVDKTAYASSAERMLMAIGEPELVNTHKDARLSRIFYNRTIKRYPAFSDFYGMEEAVERIVGYFTHAAQGLEEKKQILYLLGPVGGGKSSLAERLKELIQKFPIYVLADKDGNMSPVFESPLNLFNKDQYGAVLEKEYNIPKRYLSDVLSPWAIKRLKEYGNDKTKF